MSFSGKCARALLERCPTLINDKDIEGNTPLHFAVIYKRYFMIDHLIANGANIHQKNNNGVSPLELIAEVNTELAESVIESAQEYQRALEGDRLVANNELLSGDPQEGLFTLCTKKFEQLYLDESVLVEQLISRGANVNAIKTRGLETPLYVAAENNRHTIVALLLQHGADQMIKNVIGNIPFTCAVNYKSNECLELLLRNNSAVVNVAELFGDTPLFYAIRNGSLYSTIYYLIAKGADIHHKNYKDETPLTIAMKQGWTELADLMVKWAEEYKAKNF